ncbi:MAG: hypothetical protein KGL39_47105 [Patescibacteria group bacterium]|nr:hypothetical protein [Patescibacteria group bacterium]
MSHNKKFSDRAQEPAPDPVQNAPASDVVPLGQTGSMDSFFPAVPPMPISDATSLPRRRFIHRWVQREWFAELSAELEAEYDLVAVACEDVPTLHGEILHGYATFWKIRA